jgi:hypothetical protein
LTEASAAATLSPVVQPPFGSPPACGTCRAPLQPGALECPYCRTATPLGFQAAAQQRQQAVQQAAQQQQQAAQIAWRKRLINLETARSTAKSGLIVAAVGLPICCAPLSIVGGVMAARAIRLAKAEQIAAPTQAFVAIALAVLSTAVFSAAIALGIADSHDRSERLEAIGKTLSGKREAATIDAKTACALVEERIVEDGYDGRTTMPERYACDGPIVVQGDRAKLGGVHLEAGSQKYALGACLAKRGAWFVLEIGPSPDCTAAAPPMPASPPTTEADKRAMEKRLREAYAAGKSTAALDAFLARLGTIKDRAANAAELRESVCPSAAIQKRMASKDTRLKLPAIEFDELDRRAAPAKGGAPWSWMTSDTVRTILSPDTPLDRKASTLRDLRAESGGYLAVYRATRKVWPVVKEKAAFIGTKVAFAGGEYDGWLVLFDADTGDRLCATRLAFESGDDVSYDKRGSGSEKDRAMEAVEDDLRDHFEDAATAAIKKAAPQLRFGYKVLE